MFKYNKVPQVFDYSSDVDKILFNEEDNSARTENENTEVYPLFLNKGIVYTLNPNSGSIAEDNEGGFPSNWTMGSKNTEMVKDIINAYPKHMLRHLLLVADEKGFPVPIAGPYFTKLLDHQPGTLVANSALIVGQNGQINELTITGNLNLSGTDDAFTAINSLGKVNEIDCGYINDEDLE